jgi:hypothetical protein
MIRAIFPARFIPVANPRRKALHRFVLSRIILLKRYYCQLQVLVDHQRINDSSSHSVASATTMTTTTGGCGEGAESQRNCLFSSPFSSAAWMWHLLFIPWS